MSRIIDLVAAGNSHKDALQTGPYWVCEPHRVFHALLSLVFYLVIGALVVGGGLYLYGRARRAIGPGTRNRRRIEAAAQTYRQRQRG